MPDPLTGIVIGAGARGADAYTPYLLENSHEGSIVAVAEPDPLRRAAFAKRYGVAQDGCFADYATLLNGPRLADFALIATPDSCHVEPALAALELGYHVLLEKPMALTEPDCEALADAAEKKGLILQVCHVLRYAPLFEAVKRVVDSGELGDIVTIQHSENVSYWHYAHSYCRGNWRNSQVSSPMILAKSCHDLDLLYYLVGAPPARLTSLQRPTMLCAENAPPDAPERCIDGCPHSEVCPYDAVSMYRDVTPLLLDIRMRSSHEVGADAPSESADPPRASNWNTWPVSAISTDMTPKGVDKALRETAYGRCVYRVGDNDQPASQTVNVLFSNDVNACFTLHSTSHREGRETRIDGTLGSLVAGFYTLEQFATVCDHKSGATRTLELASEAGAHGGSDPRLFRAFLAAIRGECDPLTTAAESLWSHRMAFAADRAAREGVVISW